MNRFTEFLFKAGAWADNNKYLKAIKEAFQTFLPFTIFGAIATLWTNVIVNADTGLGALLPFIMKLSFLNPVFNAINFCTIGCISLGIAFLIGAELGKINKDNSFYCGLLAALSLIAVSKTSMTVGEGDAATAISGFFSDSLGSNGLFTALIIAILSIELFHLIMKVDALKIKMPEKVPASVSDSFSSLIPGFLVIFAMGLLSFVVQTLTGGYINDLIYNMIQAPLLKLGSSLPGIIVFVLVTVVLWSVGLHGENMTNGVLYPILLALMVENTAAVEAGGAATNIINFCFYRVFLCTGGTGMMLALTIAFMIGAKREENRSVSKIALVSNLFNIGEVGMFGFPVVLNPVLIVPFIVVSLVSVSLGYVLTAVGICPVMYINVPWTMPPFLYGMLGAGGNFMGGVCQLIVLAVATVIYLPFVKIYEKQQAANDTIVNE